MLCGSSFKSFKFFSVSVERSCRCVFTRRNICSTNKRDEEACVFPKDEPCLVSLNKSPATALLFERTKERVRGFFILSKYIYRSPPQKYAIMRVYQNDFFNEKFNASAGRPTTTDRKTGRGAESEKKFSDFGRSDGLRKNFDHGARDCENAKACSGDFSQQNPRGPALSGIQGVFPGKLRALFRLLL